MANINLKSGRYGVTELRLPVNLENKVQDIQWGTLKELENGQFVAVDSKTGKMSKAATTDDVYMVHSVPKLYEGHLSASDYVMTPDGFLPRLQRYGKGSIIATDSIIVDNSVFADFDAIGTYLATESNKAYAYLDATTGFLTVSKTKIATDCPVVFEVKSVTTMKTGTQGVELERIDGVKVDKTA